MIEVLDIYWNDLKCLELKNNKNNRKLMNNFKTLLKLYEDDKNI